jgi:SNF2 family DNA or RNA helicase
MSKNILDNRKNGNVGDYLKDKIDKDSKLSIVSAYFTIYAYREMKKELDKIDNLRFLFGEPTFVRTENLKEQKEFILSTKKREKTLAGKGFEIKLKNELTQKSVAKNCANWIKEKVEIKSLVKPNFLHGKSYIIENENKFKNSIVGSSNFTVSGLGFRNNSNMELNIATNNIKDIESLKEWFDDIWNNENLTKDVKNEVLENIKSLHKENDPEFIYFVTLYNVFRSFVEEMNEDEIIKDSTGFKDSEIWDMLYEFQKDAVIGSINKIEKYGGCIIADSVGLGKTFEALSIIKYYELRNNRVLVLAPKKLRENWEVYSRLNDKNNILSDDRFNFDILNHTDLSRYSGKSGNIDLATVNWGNYDLLVIDESHNFRNDNPVKDRVTRYQRLMQDIIKSGVKTKVLMLSATPINNRLADLKNQIAFITEGKDNHLHKRTGIKSIEQTLRKAQRVFNKWSEYSNEKRHTKSLLNLLDVDYFNLLNTLTIARSRKHVQKYYDMKKIGEFPERLPPISLKPDIDISGNFPSYKEINNTIRRLNLAIYSPLTYVLPEKRKEYNEKYDIEVKGGKSVFKQIDRERNLINLMRVNILKRLESSAKSFSLTVKKIIDKSKRQLRLAEKGFYDNQDYDISDIDIDDPELEDNLIGNKVKVLINDMDLYKLKEELEEDIERLEFLYDCATEIKVKNDNKLKKLKEAIENKIENPINQGNKKVVVFTAFTDTANYLYDNISDWILKKYGLYTALVTGGSSNRCNLETVNKNFNSLLTNFSVKSKNRDKLYPDIEEEIDILIATDCISEGQNLQDCDMLVNYDIHWNPVRIIQRFGRIDRLGSYNKKIQLINFWPNVGLNEYINLEARVKNRMVLLDVSATGEENLIKGSDLKKMNDLEYRRKQLEQLQKEVVDLEDISGGISITDMTLDDFKMDLLNYMDNNPEKIENAPTGIHGIIPIKDKYKEDLEEGAIFCLKQVSKTESEQKTNSLHPYYLIYVSKDLEVKYKHTESKKILDLYKGLCVNENQVFQWLCDEFNKKTNNGEKMELYSEMLESAVNSILGIVEEKGVESLFTTGETNIMNETISSLDDFELITFLIVKEVA